MRLRATRLTAIATAVRRALPVFSPSDLFASGAPGVWYDFADFSGLFQDAAGTTPVTAVEQPVGLVLDKSKGLVLGPELVTNGTFDTNINGWTTSGAASATWTSSGIQVSRNGAGFLDQAKSTINLVAGKTYKVSLDVTTTPTTANGGFEIWKADLSSVLHFGAGALRRNSIGNLTAFFTATATETAVVLVGISGSPSGTITFDNISVRELPGNHAFQVTSASRPILSARKNLLVGTAVLATQTVSTKAVSYVLSFWGAGTVTLSGTASGALVGTGAENRVSLTFTPTAGTLTLTVAGSVLKAQLEMINETV